MNDLIEKVGPLFWVFSILSIYGMAIVAERFLYFHRIFINTGDFLKGLSKLIRKGDFKEARHEAARLPGPIARVVEAVVSRPGLSLSELSTVAIQSAQLEVYKIEKNVRGLLVVATISPLVGVLGTIIGLIKVYMEPGFFAGRGAGFLYSEAVFQALTTTGLGLAIAIPAYLFYCYLASRARKVVHEVERAGIEAVYLLCDTRRQQDDQGNPETQADTKEPVPGKNDE